MTTKPKTKAQISAKLAEARRIGGQMANVCFNLSQFPHSVLTPKNTETMDRLRREWDALWKD